MCGILGVRARWQPARAPVEAALEALRWRGPDGARLERHGGWWLGVARLTITDARAGQPLRCARTGRVVVFNGAATSAEREWAAAGDLAATRNDAELALLRLERDGPAALTATCGPYALAVLEPDSDTLWLARDPEGEKPLFVVREAGEVIAFASSVAALRALGCPVELPAEERARLLRFGFCGPPQGNGALTVHGDLHGVWVARAGRLQPLAAAIPPEAAGERPLRERVLHAVARCAQAEVPVALALSGGVDSSCLAAALRVLGSAHAAYQFRARGAAADERDRARAVATATGLELREVDGGAEILDALPTLTRAAGVPLGDPSVLAAHALARAAASDGVRVLLSGEGADEQWLGYRRHRAARALPARGLRLLPAPQLATGMLPRLARALAAPSPYDELLAVSPPGFRRAVLVPGALADGTLPGADAPGPALVRARQADRSFYLRWDLLPKLDIATMAAGIEGRCPYLDPEVLASRETRSAAAAEILGKRPLKRAFERDLPAGILEHRKVGFGLPLDAWLRGDNPLVELLHEARTLQRPHLRGRELAAMVGRHRRGAARLGHPLYLIAAFELYLRTLEHA